jgi:hypothetical protein
MGHRPSPWVTDPFKGSQTLSLVTDPSIGPERAAGLLSPGLMLFLKVKLHLFGSWTGNVGGEAQQYSRAPDSHFLLMEIQASLTGLRGISRYEFCP